MPGETKYCSNCGEEVSLGANYCPNCGECLAGNSAERGEEASDEYSARFSTGLSAVATLFLVIAIGVFAVAFLPLSFLSLPVLWFVLSLLLCVWVYKDAKARGEEPALWLIVVLLANFIGVIIWLVVRPEKTAARPHR